MSVDVTEVRPLGGHWLRLKFEDGVEGNVDIDRIVRFTGVFEPYRGEREFAQVRVNPESGTIEWPNGADLCPDVLYSAVTGIPIEWAEPEDDR